MTKDKMQSAGRVMKIINNITEKLSDELKEKLEPGSKLSIASACFSVYAFEELRTQLEGIDALRRAACCESQPGIRLVSDHVTDQVCRDITSLLKIVRYDYVHSYFPQSFYRFAVLLYSVFA